MSEINVNHPTEDVLVFDDMLSPVGTAKRGVANMFGLWHFCGQCWIVRRDHEGCGSVVFQKRSPEKKVAPNLFDVSASGTVMVGATTIDTAISEANEELGIELKKSELINAGRRIDLFRKGDVLSRIFADVFFCINDQPLESYQFDRHELSGIAEISISSGLDLFTGRTDRIEVTIFEGAERGNSKLSVARDDFILRYDKYYLKVFRSAADLLSGNSEIAI